MELFGKEEGVLNQFFLFYKDKDEGEILTQFELFCNSGKNQ